MDAVTKLNRIGPVALLWVNAAIALLVAVAHTGFLLLVRAGKASPEMAADADLTYITIPLAIAILATAIAALIKASLRWPTLKVQALVLVLGALFMTYDGIRVAISGIPPGVNFVWNPLLFAFAVAYPVHLLQRAFARTDAPLKPVALQAPLWAIGASVVISAAVMWRVLNVAT